MNAAGMSFSATHFSNMFASALNEWVSDHMSEMDKELGMLLIGNLSRAEMEKEINLSKFIYKLI